MRDFGFFHHAKQSPAPERFNLLLVILAQKPQEEFVAEFRRANFDRCQHGDDRP